MPIYEEIIQLLWDSQDPNHSKDEKLAQLSQGAELINHWIMMVYSNYEYGSIITGVSLLEVGTMELNMVTQLGRDK